MTDILAPVRDNTENAKQEAWSVVRDRTASLDERVQGAELVIRCHHERSSWHPPKGGVHPSFERYAAAYLANDDPSDRFGEDVLAVLRARYRPDPSPCLPNGYSEWRYELDTSIQPNPNNRSRRA